jgi:fluoroquinolone transport system permease protein
VSIARTGDSVADEPDQLVNAGWINSTSLARIELLPGHKARLVRWKPTLGGVVVGYLILYQSSDGWSTGSIPATLPLRMAALALCLGAVFVLDDKAAVTVASVPSTLRYRRFVRVVLIVPLVAAAWAGQLAYVFVHTTNSLHLDTEGLLPIWGLTLELTGMMIAGLAIAAFAIRRLSEGSGGVAAGPTLLMLFGAGMFLPERWTLFPGSMDDPQWAAAHVRWAIIGVLATLLLLYFSRDPASRSFLRWFGDR